MGNHETTVRPNSQASGIMESEHNNQLEFDNDSEADSVADQDKEQSDEIVFGDKGEGLIKLFKIRPFLIPFRGISDESRNIIFKALEEDNVGTIQALAQKTPDIILLDLNEDYSTMLHHACLKNAPRCTAFILKHMYSRFKGFYEEYINLQTMVDRSTALMHCCQHGAYACGMLLLNNGGVNTELTNLMKKTALKMTGDEQFAEMIEKHLQNKAVDEKMIMSNKDEDIKKYKLHESKMKLIPALRDPVPTKFLAFKQEVQVETTRKTMSKYRDTVTSLVEKKQFYSNPKTEHFCEQMERLFSKDRLSLLRPYEIFDDSFQYKLYDGITPDDVRMGSSKNSYYLAAIACLALKPDKVKSLFRNGKNIYGYYVLELCINGKLTEVQVDDRFPCDSKKQPVGCKPNGKEIWAMLLEKAWLAQFKVLSNASFILAESIIEDIAGVPCRGAFISKKKAPDSLFSLLYHKKQASSLLIAVGRTSAEKQLNHKGHSYIVIDIRVYNKPPLKPVKLFKLKNTEGTYEWKGQYSDESPNWTPELVSHFGMKKAADGIFYVTASQFVDLFQYYCEVHIRDNYFYSSFPLLFNRDEHVFFKFSIKSKQQVNIRCFQMFKKYSEETMIRGDLAYNQLVFETVYLGRKGDPNPRLVAVGDTSKCLEGAKSVHFSSRVFEELEEGEYLVHLRSSGDFKGALGIYCAQKDVKISQETDESMKYLKQAYYKLASVQGDKISSLQDFGQLKQYDNKSGDIIVCYVPAPVQSTRKRLQRSTPRCKLTMAEGIEFYTFDIGKAEPTNLGKTTYNELRVGKRPKPPAITATANESKEGDVYIEPGSVVTVKRRSNGLKNGVPIRPKFKYTLEAPTHEQQLWLEG